MPGYAVHEPHYEHRRKRKNHVGLLWTARRESRKNFGLVLAIVRETVVGPTPESPVENSMEDTINYLKYVMQIWGEKVENQVALSPGLCTHGAHSPRELQGK